MNRKADAYRLGVHAGLKHAGATDAEAQDLLALFEKAAFDAEQIIRQPEFQTLVAGVPDAIQCDDAFRLGIRDVLKTAGCTDAEASDGIRDLMDPEATWESIKTASWMGAALRGAGNLASKGIGAIGRGMGRAGEAMEGAAGRMAPKPQMPHEMPTQAMEPVMNPREAPTQIMEPVGGAPKPPMPGAGTAPKWWTPRGIAGGVGRAATGMGFPGVAQHLEQHPWHAAAPAYYAAARFGPGIARHELNHFTGADQAPAAPQAPEQVGPQGGMDPRELQLLMMMAQERGFSGGGYSGY